MPTAACSVRSPLGSDMRASRLMSTPTSSVSNKEDEWGVGTTPVAFKKTHVVRPAALISSDRTGWKAKERDLRVRDTVAQFQS